MKSTSPPTIRCATGGSGGPGSAVLAAAGEGCASDEGLGAAAGDALDTVAPIELQMNAATTAQLSFRIDLVTLQL
jgi:hypothetical protein